MSEATVEFRNVDRYGQPRYLMSLSRYEVSFLISRTEMLLNRDSRSEDVSRDRAVLKELKREMSYRG